MKWSLNVFPRLNVVLSWYSNILFLNLKLHRKSDILDRWLQQPPEGRRQKQRMTEIADREREGQRVLLIYIVYMDSTGDLRCTGGGVHTLA